jgi:hypothetical protein
MWIMMKIVMRNGKRYCKGFVNAIKSFFLSMKLFKLIHILKIMSKTDILIFQEDPGESLSDCDKDEEEESLEEGCSRADEEDESEDGFFVPDGYLSENEV